MNYINSDSQSPLAQDVLKGLSQIYKSSMYKIQTEISRNPDTSTGPTTTFGNLKGKKHY